MRTTLFRSFRLSANAGRIARAARRAVLVGGVAPLLLAACSDSDSPTGPTPVTGAYPMSTVRGFSVPHTFTDAAGKKLTIEGGGLSLAGSGTFTLAYKGKLNALVFDLTDEGTYTISGGTVTFVPDDGDGSYTGTVQGKSILVKDFRIAGVKFDLAFKAS